MPIPQIGLVSRSGAVPAAEVMIVADAIQKQVLRDLAPFWDVSGAISPFAQVEHIPVDSWPVIIQDKVYGAHGLHQDGNGRPYALIEAGSSWSLIASHEILEMLVDPHGRTTVAGEALDDANRRVEYLLEICDPCQAEEFAYASNGVVVSDFYTKNYFDPVAAPGIKYSYTGAISRPREVLPGGYLTWHDSETGRWMRATSTSIGGISTVVLGNLDPGRGSIRAQVDDQTPGLKRLGKLAKSNRSMKRFVARRTGVEISMKARAKSLLDRIDRVLAVAKERDSSKQKPSHQKRVKG